MKLTEINIKGFIRECISDQYLLEKRRRHNWVERVSGPPKASDSFSVNTEAGIVLQSCPHLGPRVQILGLFIPTATSHKIYAAPGNKGMTLDHFFLFGQQQFSKKAKSCSCHLVTLLTTGLSKSRHAKRELWALHHSVYDSGLLEVDQPSNSGQCDPVERKPGKTMK